MTTAPHAFGPAVAAPAEATHVTGRRVAATIIDGLIFGVAYWLLALVFGDLRTEGEAANWVADLPVVASMAYGLFVVGYYVLLEGFLGQTLGKMAMGIKVVAEATGQTPGSPRRRSGHYCGSSTACSGTPWPSSRCWRRTSGNGWVTWPPAPWWSAPKQAPRSSPCNLGDWFSGAPGPGRSRR
jgi:hypothetical protein